MVSVKVEDKACKIPQLNTEAKWLQQMNGTKGFAKYYWYGETAKHRYLVMSFLG
jgi:hypothetical protein